MTTSVRHRLLLPLGIDLAALAAICLFYENNTLLAAILGALLAVALAHRFSRFKLILAAWAGFFGTLGEIVCCAPAVRLWIYENPTFLGLPGWLPLVWPILLLTFTEMADCLDAVAEQRFGESARTLLTHAALALIVMYAGVAFFLIHKVIAGVFLIFLILMLLFSRSLHGMLLFWVAAFGGSLGEYICIQNGVWTYTRPFFTAFGIPLSLPLAWGLSANIIFMLTRSCLPCADRIETASEQPATAVSKGSAIQ